MVLLAVAVCPLPANAHDPSAWGGLFRSRDDGATWFPADAGLFIGGAIAVAVNPKDANHLLYGTDTRFLRSRNGGRDWVTEAQNEIGGAVFAVAFDRDGKAAVASTTSRIFYTADGSAWKDTLAPGGAAPARAIVPGNTPGNLYLAGARGLFMSSDHGQTWLRVGEGALPEAAVAAILVTSVTETVHAVIDGKIWTSAETAKTWRAGGVPAGRVDALAADTLRSGRLWCVATDQVYLSDDAGVTWKAHGKPLPEPGTSVRGVAAADDGRILVLTTHRGVLRSTDGGETWSLVEGTLPVHLEAGPLIRDPHDAATLYAGFALSPYSEIWRRAEQGGSLLAQLDPFSLAGGLAFLILLVVIGVIVTRWLSRRYRDTDVTPRFR